MRLAALALPLVLACGAGVGSWTASDTRKANEILIEEQATLQLCSDEDEGTCQPSHVRALGEVIRCKASSLLFTHRQPIPDDAGGDCHR